jgi:hypothetical protein
LVFSLKEKRLAYVWIGPPAARDFASVVPVCVKSRSIPSGRGLSSQEKIDGEKSASVAGNFL